MIKALLTSYLAVFAQIPALTVAFVLGWILDHRNTRPPVHARSVLETKINKLAEITAVASRAFTINLMAFAAVKTGGPILTKFRFYVTRIVQFA